MIKINKIIMCFSNDSKPLSVTYKLYFTLFLTSFVFIVYIKLYIYRYMYPYVCRPIYILFCIGGINGWPGVLLQDNLFL